MILVACSDGGPEPGFDVTGLWTEQGGGSALEFTEDGGFNLNFDPPLSDGTFRWEGESFNRTDNSHLTLVVVMGRPSLEIIEVEATINSENVLRFRLDGKVYRFIRTEAGSPVSVPAAASGNTWSRPADGMTMVYVPAGEFEMGSTEGEVDDALELCNAYHGNCNRALFELELPMHTVALDGFWIDRTEVTNAQYQACVQTGLCSPPAQSSSATQPDYYGNTAFDDYPVLWVSWNEATAYCRWAGARLPTEAEWEYAARGPQGRVFPWGDAFEGMRANYCDANCDRDWADEAVDDDYTDTAPVGSYPAGASWVGALDTAGNVLEWVADWYGVYHAERQENPTGPTTGRARVLRGGSWVNDASRVRSADRSMMPADRWHDVGFRCARSSE